MYDPTVGRFLQQDPLGLALDENPYRFAENSPTQSTATECSFVGARRLQSVPARGLHETLRYALVEDDIAAIGRADAASARTVENGSAALYDEEQEKSTEDSESADAEQLHQQALTAVDGDADRVSGLRQLARQLPNPFLSPDEQFLEKVTQGRTKPLGRLFIIDHSHTESYEQSKDARQQIGDLVMTEKDIKLIAKYVAKNGVIVFSGCNVGLNEAYLVKMAAAAQRRVRAYQGLTSGSVPAADELFNWDHIERYWVEADTKGNIRYYVDAYVSTPRYVKMKGRIFIEYVTNSDGKRTANVYRWRYLRDGTIIIYDAKTHRVVMVQDKNGLIRTKENADKGEGKIGVIGKDERKLTSLQASGNY